MPIEAIAQPVSSQPSVVSNLLEGRLNGKKITSVHTNGTLRGSRKRKATFSPAQIPTQKRARKRGRDPRPLPTFPLEVGWRERFDPSTGRVIQQPLTLYDLLNPKEEEIGIVVMTQGPIHDLLSRRFSESFTSYLSAEGWLVLHDVLINWNIPGVSSRAPDVALIDGGRRPAEGNESYHVGRDGPMPDFVIEITSESTRNVDLVDKPTLYAMVGIPEFLIIDKGTPASEPWLLRGYRLEDNPTYDQFFADETGRISFEWIGLQFEVVGREHIHVYDMETGQRWLIAEEQKERADAEAARADAEAVARSIAEAQVEAERVARSEAEAKLAKAHAQLRALGIEP